MLLMQFNDKLLFKRRCWSLRGTLGSSGGSYCTIQSTRGMSRPLAATSIHNKMDSLELQNWKKVWVLLVCFCFPFKSNIKRKTWTKTRNVKSIQVFDYCWVTQIIDQSFLSWFFRYEVEKTKTSDLVLNVQVFRNLFHRQSFKLVSLVYPCILFKQLLHLRERSHLNL